MIEYDLINISLNNENEAEILTNSLTHVPASMNV